MGTPRGKRSKPRNGRNDRSPKNVRCYHSHTRRRTSVFREFCERLGSVLDPTDRSGLGIAIKSGDTSKLAGINPSAFTCPDSYRIAYLLHEVARKFPSFPGDDRVREEATLSLFRKAEQQCLETNMRLQGAQTGISFQGVSVEAVIHTASRKIAHLLGDMDLNEAAADFGFGPGATTRLPRRRADAWYKFQGTPETSFNNTNFANAIFEHWPLWKDGDILSEDGLPYQVVPGNRVVSVPKNAKVDRLIAIEPDLNLFVQKGFGSMIRRRLKRVGVDLDDQTLNQRLARLGSLDGSLATIDLSMASDTLSYRVVELLLPPQWFDMLLQCRSPSGVFASTSETVLYRKFSSMGNGFTFELESLIFWAICSSVVETLCPRGSTIAVYGDDIIVPTESALAVIEVLNHFGFTPNHRKSFVDGPFRESCGKHYFLGSDVTPFYVDSDVRSNADIVLLANQIVRWSVRSEFRGREFPHRDKVLKPVYDWLVSLLPDWYKDHLIPDGYGDGSLIGDWDEICPDPLLSPLPRDCRVADPLKKAKKSGPTGVEGWLVSTVIPRMSRDKRVGGHASLLKALYTHRSKWCARDPSKWDISVRPDILGSAGCLRLDEVHEKGKILVTRIPFLGPWF